MSDQTDPNGAVFSLLAEISGHLRGANERADRNRLSATRVQAPALVRFRASIIIPSNGFAVATFDQPGPSQGYRWNVRRLTVTGLNPTDDTGTARADVFVSAGSYSQATSFDQITVADWVDQAVALPLFGFYGNDEQPLVANEKISIAFSSATSGQQLIATGLAWQFQDGANLQGWAV